MLQFAKVLKSNGTDGGLLMGLNNVNPEDIDIKEPVFVYMDGLPVPFFISSITAKGNGRAIVHLVDIETFDDAEELVGRDVFTRNGGDGDEEDGFDDLVGWTLLDAGNGNAEVGKITDYIDYAANPCLEVQWKGSEVLVPLHEDLVESVDPAKKEISLHIPDGLLDL